jgi:hypothetical protein
MSDPIKRLVVLANNIDAKYGKKKEEGEKEFHLPAGHKPYMVLAKGGTGPFSCANCTAMYEKDGEYHCKSPDYQAYMGGSLLVDENGDPLEDPSISCSDWFTPNPELVPA